MSQLQNKVIVKGMAENDKTTILNYHSGTFYYCLEIFLSLLLLELNLFFECSFVPFVFAVLKMCTLIAEPHAVPGTE